MPRSRVARVHHARGVCGLARARDGLGRQPQRAEPQDDRRCLPPSATLVSAFTCVLRHRGSRGNALGQDTGGSRQLGRGGCRAQGRLFVCAGVGRFDLCQGDEGRALGSAGLGSRALLPGGARNKFGPRRRLWVLERRQDDCLARECCPSRFSSALSLVDPHELGDLQEDSRAMNNV